MPAKLSGLIAATFTPFLPSGELTLKPVPLMADLLARNGASGAFICGTTGEGFSMTAEERRRTAKAWRAATPPGLKLIVHVGHLSLKDSCRLAKHAQDIGADAIASIAPCFFKPATAAELVGWCQRVAAAAPLLPFYYYHMPAMTGVAISATEFLACADGKIPTLAGIKFTHEDLNDYHAARQFADGRYDILFGRDEILLSGLKLGATGAVGSTYNFAAPLYLNIMRAFRQGDGVSAEQAQASAQAFIDTMARFGGLPAGKAMMKFIGMDCGPVRLPLKNLTPQEEAALHAELKTQGFFGYASVL